MAPRDALIEHLLRRVSFGATPQEFQQYSELGYATALDQLLKYEQFVDDVDSYIGKPGYVAVTATGAFEPNATIGHSRQRWLFRMVHSARPLEEKMTLFWHNHFATGYSKVAGALGATEGARAMAAKPSEDPAGFTGQIELLRKYATGNFRDLLLAIAKDVAMLVWLDGRSNIKSHPQENFARELMELFTFGVGHYTEPDVYAGARVFTGWNMARVGGNGPTGQYQFTYVASQHETSAKEFSFPIYANGSKVIPARSASDGMQDGIDLINAVAAHPETGPRLARKLYAYFVNEVEAPDEGLVSALASTYYQNNFEIKPVLLRLFTSPQFVDSSNFHKRYAWPAEFVVRSLKEMGWVGFSVNDVLNPMITMGQQLFEPPDVAGWDLGQSWFTSGSMLARMNFAAQLATNQKFELRDAAKPFVRSPESLVSWVLDRMTASSYPTGAYNALVDYVRAGGTWTNSDAQILAKTAGLAHLVGGSGEYQLV